MKRMIGPLVAMLLLVAGSASAGSIVVTPPLLKGSAAFALCCITNLDTKEPANPTVELIKYDGAVDTTIMFSIAAGGFACLGDNTPVGSYCRVSGVPSNRVRVSFCMADANSDCMATVTAPTK